MRFMKNWLVAILAMSLLSACGGGGDSADPIAESPGGGNDPIVGTSSEISGAVADGYLENATVFCDLDGDLTWDSGEPKTTSGTNGAFVLSGSQLSGCTVVAKAVPGVTVDTDNPGSALTRAFTFTAPVAPEGQETFVSPISTFVNQRIKEGKAKEQAVIEVSQLLGASNDADILQDYIAVGNTDLHQAAQAITQAMAQLQEMYENEGSTVSDPVEILDGIVAQVESDLDQVTAGDYEPTKPVTAEMVSGKSFVFTSGTTISLMTFNADGTTSEWANDYGIDSLPIAGTWKVVDGLLMLSDAYGDQQRRMLTEEEDSLIFVSNVADYGHDAKWAILSMKKVKPFTEEFLVGQTFRFSGEGDGTLAFFSDYSGELYDSDGVRPFTWDVTNGIVRMSLGINIHKIAGEENSIFDGFVIKEDGVEIVNFLSEPAAPILSQVLTGKKATVNYDRGEGNYEFLPDGIVKGGGYTGEWEVLENGNLKMIFPGVESYPSIFKISEIGNISMSFVYQHNESIEWEGPKVMSFDQPLLPQVFVGKKFGVAYDRGNTSYDFISSNQVDVISSDGSKYQGLWRIEDNGNLVMSFDGIDDYPAVFNISYVESNLKSLTFVYQHNTSTEWEGPKKFIKIEP